MVRVDLVEDLGEGEGFLVQDLHKVVEDLILNVHLLLLFLNHLEGQVVILLVEFFKLLVLDKSILVRVDLFEQLQEILPLKRDAVNLRHHDLHVADSQEPDAALVHSPKGILRSAYHLQLLLYRTEHLCPFHLLSEPHVLLLCGASRAHKSPARGRRLPLLVLEDVVVGVGSPELLQELLLRDVALLVFVQLREEYLHLLV